MADILTPALGESVAEATIAKWTKKAGDAVRKDEMLVELETDKVSLEVVSPADGVLSEIKAAEGDTVIPGTVLGVVTEGAPIMVRFLTEVASRFGVVVSQKVAAQTFPVIGALGGAAVNYAFLEHFQDVARGHFTVRRLERIYGKTIIREEYTRLAEKH